MKKFLTGALLALCALTSAALAQTVITQQDPAAQLVSLSSVGNKTNVMNVGTTTTVQASGQSGVIISSSSVSSGKVFYLSYMSIEGLVKGATVTTATDLGVVKFQSPAGTTVLQHHPIAYQGASQPYVHYFSEPIPLPASQTYKVTVDPAYNGSADFIVNYGGYER